MGEFFFAFFAAFLPFVFLGGLLNAWLTKINERQAFEHEVKQEQRRRAIAKEADKRGAA